ncbi:MAG TPA: hypothetical protein VMV15_09310 [Candidatus Binataceae bacterium]|nr:hypothetical protein [Candidatus Binataceae bacterium]
MKRRLFVVPFVAASLLAVLPVSSTSAQQGDTGSLTEPSPPVPDQQPDANPCAPPIKSIPECKPGQTAKDGCVPECKPGQTTVNDDCVAGPFPLNMKDFAKKYKPDYTKPLGRPFHQYFGHSALDEYYMEHPGCLHPNGPNASSETLPVRPPPAAAPPQPDSSPSSLNDPATVRELAVVDQQHRFGPR